LRIPSRIILENGRRELSEADTRYNLTAIGKETRWIDYVSRPIIEIGVQTSKDTSFRELDYTWECKEFHGTSMLIQLYFQNPLLVSSGDHLDLLSVKFWAGDFFKNAKGLPLIAEATLMHKLPPQISLFEGKIINSYAVTIETGTKMVIVSNFIANIFVIGALQ
jgi:hypothetical protein